MEIMQLELHNVIRTSDFGPSEGDEDGGFA